MVREHFYKLGYIFFLNLSIITLLLIALNQFEIIALWRFLTESIIFSILILSIGLYVLFKSKFNEAHHINSKSINSFFHVAPYFFLAILIILAINQFAKLEVITLRNVHLTVLGIFFGFFAFYSNRDRIEGELENEKKKEEDEEKERAEEFEYRFPRINSIWGLRSIVKWMYKEGWVYSLGLILIVAIGFMLRIWNLGQSSFWDDEITIVYTAINLLEGHGFTLLSGENYFVTLPSSLLVAISFLFLTPSEFTARIPFVILGTIFIVITYSLFRRVIGNRPLSLLLTLSISTSLWLISYSREVRMYSLNTIIALMSVYLFYKFLETDKNKWLIYLGISLIFGIINHTLILILFPSVFILMFLNFRKFPKYNKKFLFLIGIFILTVSILYYKTIIYYISSGIAHNFWRNGSAFYLNLFLDKFQIMSIIIISIIFVKIFTRPNNYDIAFLFSSFLTILIMSFFILAKLERYSLFIYPLFLTASIIYLYSLIKIKIKNPVIVLAIMFLTIILVLSPIYDGYRVSQNKISYDPILQKNKYSWNEATKYLSNLLIQNPAPVVTSNGMLTHFYGVNATYTFKSGFYKPATLNFSKSYYDNLEFIELENLREAYIIADQNKFINYPYYELLISDDYELLYWEEGIKIYYLGYY